MSSNVNGGPCYSTCAFVNSYTCTFQGIDWSQMLANSGLWVSTLIFECKSLHSPLSHLIDFPASLFMPFAVFRKCNCCFHHLNICQLTSPGLQSLGSGFSECSVVWRLFENCKDMLCFFTPRMSTTNYGDTGWWDASRIELSVTLAGKRKFETGTKRLIWPNRRCYFMLLLSLKLFHILYMYIYSKWNRLPSHLSGMAARLQALWAKGWSSYNSPLGVTTACLQTLPKMPNPRKGTLNLHRCFYFRWRRRHTNLFWPEMLKLAADLAAVCSWGPELGLQVEEADCWQYVRMSRNSRGNNKRLPSQG